MTFSRPIQHLWISVTSRCNFRCGYCYVRKNGKTVESTVARQAIDLLSASPGTDKVLDLYGGEPFMARARVREITTYAMTAAQRHKKRLSIKIATNGALIRSADLPWLEESGAWLSVSMDGEPSAHDAFRRTAGGKGTFKSVADRADLLLGHYNPDRVQALLTVHPEQAPRLGENVVFLLNLGFRNFHLNPVTTLEWSDDDRRVFGDEMQSIKSEIHHRIQGRSFVFFEPLSQELRRRVSGRNDSQDDFCPLFKRLTILPSGSAAFLPDLCYEKAGGRLRIGALAKAIRRFEGCTLDPMNPRCRACSRHYRSPNLKGFEVEAHRLRNSAAAELAQEILSRHHDRSYSEYTDLASGRLFE